jgi:hypothetical protein
MEKAALRRPSSSVYQITPGTARVARRNDRVSGTTPSALLQ